MYEPTPETETNELPETADVSTKEVNINEPCILLFGTQTIKDSALLEYALQTMKMGHILLNI